MRINNSLALTNASYNNRNNLNSAKMSSKQSFAGISEVAHMSTRTKAAGLLLATLVAFPAHLLAQASKAAKEVVIYIGNDIDGVHRGFGERIRIPENSFLSRIAKKSDDALGKATEQHVSYLDLLDADNRKGNKDLFTSFAELGKQLKMTEDQIIAKMSPEEIARAKELGKGNIKEGLKHMGFFRELPTVIGLKGYDLKAESVAKAPKGKVITFKDGRQAVLSDGLHIDLKTGEPLMNYDGSQRLGSDRFQFYGEK